MRIFESPKKLLDSELLWVIHNVLPNKYGCPLKLKNWYKEVKKEFYNRDIKLEWLITAK